MKKFLASWVFSLASVVAFATLPIIDNDTSWIEAPKLLPANHPACRQATTTTTVPLECAMGSQFYVDQNGRCGCLAPEMVTPSDECIRSFIICNVMAGETFSGLFQWVDNESIYVGCGCFGTTHEMNSRL